MAAPPTTAEEFEKAMLAETIREVGLEALWKALQDDSEDESEIEEWPT